MTKEAEFGFVNAVLHVGAGGEWAVPRVDTMARSGGCDHVYIESVQMRADADACAARLLTVERDSIFSREGQ